MQRGSEGVEFSNENLRGFRSDYDADDYDVDGGNAGNQGPTRASGAGNKTSASAGNKTSVTNDPKDSTNMMGMSVGRRNKGSATPEDLIQQFEGGEGGGGKKSKKETYDWDIEEDYERKFH